MHKQLNKENNSFTHFPGVTGNITFKIPEN